MCDLPWLIEHGGHVWFRPSHNRTSVIHWDGGDGFPICRRGYHAFQHSSCLLNNLGGDDWHRCGVTVARATYTKNEDGEDVWNMAWVRSIPPCNEITSTVKKQEIVKGEELQHVVAAIGIRSKDFKKNGTYQVVLPPSLTFGLATRRHSWLYDNQQILLPNRKSDHQQVRRLLARSFIPHGGGWTVTYGHSATGPCTSIERMHFREWDIGSALSPDSTAVSVQMGHGCGASQVVGLAIALERSMSAAILTTGCPYCQLQKSTTSGACLCIV
ncbi:uncharacterized protein VTP21DRAFT_11355 [Calcarisporiella thermophila]|uniref:uncharacterized protein n=1 Tax=Calcarisporiella thermophila TaxID=911321 RepID=UPI00374273D9